MAVLQRPLVLLVTVILMSHGKLSFAKQELHITMYTDGRYTISVDQGTWLTSADTYIYAAGSKQTVGQGLKLVETDGVSGVDKLGNWNGLTFQYLVPSINASFHATIKVYDNFVVFAQKFITPVQGTTSGEFDSVISSFPSFGVGSGNTSLGYVSFGGNMVGDTHMKWGKFKSPDATLNYGIIGGPLVLFDSGSDAIIIAPFNQFMAASLYHDVTGNSVHWGIMGGVNSVPKDYVYETILFYSPDGVNRAFSEFGRLMKFYYDKDESYRKSDLTINYLGYWTDNGAFYYYNTETNTTYERTMIDVRKYTVVENIPYRYFQFDSWFYPKDEYGGVKTWVAMEGIFPDGLRYVWNALDLPIAAHNRYWSSQTTYAIQNGGKFKFLLEPPKAIPVDQTFWDSFFQDAKQWGLILYEQDWLDVEFSMNITRSDIYLGREWLLQMGAGARKNDLTIQYCMSLPRHAMQSLEIPVVTQARVSGDYQPGNDQWRIGISSMFADALGLAPFKDTFWTTTNQTGNKYGKSEPNVVLQSAVATLSTGPVGPSDKISATDPDLLMRCCNQDGLILKPSRPATAIDKQLHRLAFDDGVGPAGEIWTTYTEISGYYFGIILAADLSEMYPLTPQDAGFQFGTPKVFNYDDGHSEAMNFSDQYPLKLQDCPKEAPCVWYTSSIFQVGKNEILIYGEVNKWVPMSPERVQEVLVSDDIEIHLQGSAGEEVTFAFFVNGVFTPNIHCTIGNDGTAILRFNSLNCS
ncbi:hypothetical protein ACJMK2_032671 [Sinanodonta woodiana]|uniref:Uncharacterized protein n=1 Tax=Sinanodonta woodiana TaxID=1069815 RepID=A0ABD3X617_SINWO